MPQQTQGLGALQSAYSQFQNSAPPQPNSVFGQQPMGGQMAQQLGQMGGQPMGGQTQLYQDAVRQPNSTEVARYQQMLGGMQPQASMQPQNRVQEPPNQMLQQQLAMQPQPGQQRMAMRPPAMPQASNFSQMRQEDPRMQAMRNMQRYGGRR
jgi:hypothetical protein